MDPRCHVLLNIMDWGMTSVIHEHSLRYPIVIMWNGVHLAPGHLQISWWRTAIGANRECPEVKPVPEPILLYLQWYTFLNTSQLMFTSECCRLNIKMYRKTSNIRRTLVGNQIVDHPDVVGTSPVGAVPTTSSFSTWNLASRDSTKTAARQYENLLRVRIWCVLY